MIKTTWKTKEEILFSLSSKKKIGVISCGLCAGLSGTGGFEGLKMLKDLLEAQNKTITFGTVCIANCQEDLMRQIMSYHKKSIKDSDAIAVLSCASGVKTAVLHSLDVPVIPILDTLGAIPVSHSENEVAKSLCVSCGECVLAYTKGICPVSECPLHLKYGPCGRTLENGHCYIKTDQICIWTTIIDKNVDLNALKELRKLHRKAGEGELEKPVLDEELEQQMLSYRRRKIVTMIRESIAWFGAHFKVVAKLLTLFR